MKIALLGYGKMGKTIESLINENEKHNIEVVVDAQEEFLLKKKEIENCDVAIEFSTPKTVLTNISKCFEIDLPIVVGTTGWYNHLNTIEDICAKEKKSLVWASNFSIGVNIFFQVNKKLASIMNKFEDYSCHIEETHHTTKLDAPSGTAISLANGIIENHKKYNTWKLQEEAHEKNFLTINAIRKENVKGDHKIRYQNNIDEIEISHKAFNRKGFALGAILAAEWIVANKGFHSFEKVLNI